MAVYSQHFIIRQLIPLKNQPPNLEEHSFKSNEVKLVVPVYNNKNDEFHGLNEMLAYIMLRGDQDEVFFSYGHLEEKSTVLFCSAKERMPNAFISTAFHKHLSKIINESNRQKSSKLHFFLCSTTNRKEKINQYLNVFLTLIDCIYKKFKQYSPKCKDFNASDLNLTLGNEKRSIAPDAMYSFFKDAVEISNANLISNADHILKTSK